MLPVHRWFLSGLGALWSCAAFAQTAVAQPEVDESKIPEWVKRQARSPYKVILESNTVRAKPVTPKDDDSAKRAVKKLPLKTATTAAESTRSSPTTAEAAPAPAPAPTNTGTTSVPLPPTLQAQEAPVESAAVPELSKLSAVVLPSEPPPLTLVKRVEPVLAAELLDSRLNTAKVVVEFTVNANGEVVNPSVASTSDSRLNRSVLRAVQGWRYAPIPAPREHRVSFAFTTE